MSEIYIIGSFSTEFKKWPDKSIKDLARMDYLGVIKDAGIDIYDIQSCWFSNCGWGYSLPAQDNDQGQKGQMNVRGHVAMAPLVREGLFPRYVPITNVEGACSSGSMALIGARKDILSGQSSVALALGAEKTFFPGHYDKVLENFGGGTDVTEFPRLSQLYAKLYQEIGREWAMKTDHTLFMDVYAAWAAWHMWKWGTTREQLAIIASKNHHNGSLNPLAQYRFEVPVEKVLSDYPVSWPLTRSMCAPIGDGAAAAILCSKSYYKKLPRSIQKRAIRILASEMATGSKEDIEGFPVGTYVANKAYKAAGVGPRDISLAEVHDATAMGELMNTEELGFCPVGEGGKFAESGATSLDGKIPFNTSGGLESKGHPIGATGLSQINEVVMQLRGEAGQRQINAPRVGLVENGGGVVGFEGFNVAVTILKK